MNKQLEQKKGFTIIEVVLVLAIAGLIFLMVFIALPALQRSQRDSARKNEVGTIASAITSYQSNNRNAAPEAEDIVQYVTGEEGSDQLDSGATVIVAATSYSADRTLNASLDSTSQGANDLGADEVKVFFGYKCNPDDNEQLIRGTTKQAAVAVALESGPASGSVYCQTN